MNQNNNDQIILDKINNFINSANQTLSCDAECQKKNQENKLKAIYLDSLSNSASSSAKEKIAYKNYIIATQGQEAYDDQIDKQLNEKAQKISDEFKKIFDEYANNIETSLGSYNGLLINFQNIIDYYILYSDKNIEFENKSKIKTSDVITNERKTYYENQDTERIKYINTIFFYFYYLLVILYFIFIFIYPSDYSYLKMGLILFFLIIYPFIASKIFLLFIYIYNFVINNILPKNVYKTI
jgi:hypothetical protein